MAAARRTPSPLVVVLLVAGLVVAIVAAGAALVVPRLGSSYQYVSAAPGTSGGRPVYFRVPGSWTSFDPKAIDKAESGWSSDADSSSLLSVTAWQRAFDASPDPSLDHVLGRAVPEHPVAFASLRATYTAEQDAGTGALRDLVLPVSTLGSAVRISTDQTLTQGGATGIHLVMTYRPATGSPEETIDQIAYLSDDQQAVYLLVVRCSSTCYAQHRDEIATLTSSFTIQEARRG